MKEKIVCVEWDDASYTSGFYDPDKPRDFSPIKTRSVGRLIKRDKTGIVLAMERFYDDKGQPTGDRHIHTIPRKMVKKVTYLRGE